ncbi:hypothetical protein [Alkalimarinus coralli]|uniref:hypothetical protein n=1 Tax=Alkalimarinus coralli TaxID=2935863 RepID=UPI00202B1D76|nr:hypothetical protein [Alkalimarinus coralli]
MLATKQPEHCLTPLFRHTTLLLILLALLSGCSIYPEKDIDSEESTPSAKERPNDKAKERDAAPDGEDKHSKQDSDGSETKTGPDAEGTQPLCVYETTKGIAEVKDVNKERVRFKFYPGDHIFQKAASDVTYTDIKPGQELKAIARTPISGPCSETEFELLTSVQ